MTERLTGAAKRTLADLRWNSEGALFQVAAILLAFIVGALVLYVSGYDPASAYAAMLRGAFGDMYGVGQTLTQATPIVFTSLAFLISSKAGLFNIGAEGQFLVGAFTSSLVGIYLAELPWVLHIPLALLAGAAAGGAWGLIAAVLKTRFNAHEVITTMMLTYVATYLTGYMVNYPFKAPGWVSQTVKIAPSAELPRILPPTQLSAGILVAVALVAFTAYLLRKTILGFELRAIGLNPSAAESAGISINRGIMAAMFLSGAMAGLGGACEILGVHRRFIEGFSPGYGWDGLAVALVGGLDPVGSLLAAILFGALRSGGMIMTRSTKVPLDIVIILQGLVIVFVAAPAFIRSLLKRRRK
ncbi:MAG TPA: ABC transporter permease [Candidatus Bathyarchaeia archaeon]